MQREIQAGRAPAGELIEGVLVLIGGIVLLTPGLLTDLAGFALMVPGIRPAGSDHGDQKRIMTPHEALGLGATHLVIGRPITQSPDPAKAAQAIIATIA